MRDAVLTIRPEYKRLLTQHDVSFNKKELQVLVFYYLRLLESKLASNHALRFYFSLFSHLRSSLSATSRDFMQSLAIYNKPVSIQTQHLQVLFELILKQNWEDSLVILQHILGYVNLTKKIFMSVGLYIFYPVK